MSVKDVPGMIYGIPREEYTAMADDPATMEEYAARRCPEMYVLAMEMGTMVVRGSDLGLSEKAWRDQRRELEARGWELNGEAAKESDEAYYWTLKAFTFGERAGMDEPMQKFEVRGGLK
jgi:hypothetical protein